MKKEEMIKFLNDRHINVSDLNYTEIQKIYFNQVKLEKHASNTNIDTAPNTNNVTDVNKTVDISNTIDNILSGDTVQDKILEDIINLMSELQFKVRKSQTEINEMFRLYNLYFKRKESPSCSQCINNVWASMIRLYKNFNK
jgi:LEA14-like dessication related protein